MTSDRGIVPAPFATSLRDRIARASCSLAAIIAGSPLFVPLVASRVSAGFPSPADDYLDRPLNLNELLIRNPPATFAAWVEGDSMIGVGIHHGDLAIVDRSMTVKDGLIILALVDAQFFLKRFRKQSGRIWLQSENPAYPDFHINDGSTFEVWGGIRHTIRMLYGR